MMSPAYMISHDSYERCLKVPDFVANLYEKLLCRDPAVAPLFAQAEFTKQHQLLQHRIGLLGIYAKGADDESLGRAAARHSSAGMDIIPDMYPVFMGALLHAVSCGGPVYDTPVSEAWQEALCSGVEFTKRRYNG
jgi:hemoglobin-like flavoprotein